MMSLIPRLSEDNFQTPSRESKPKWILKNYSLRDVLPDVVQHGLSMPVDLLVLLGEGVFRVQRPGHHILLRPRSNHLASAARRTAASPLCGSEMNNHIRLLRCL